MPTQNNRQLMVHMTVEKQFCVVLENAVYVFEFVEIAVYFSGIVHKMRYPYAI